MRKFYLSSCHSIKLSTQYARYGDLVKFKAFVASCTVHLIPIQPAASKVVPFFKHIVSADQNVRRAACMAVSINVSLAFPPTKSFTDTA